MLDLPTAARLARGLTRHFHALGWACLPEFTLASGRRLDLLALSPGSRLVAVEIKSCRADFLADGKWHEYLDYCDAFYFAVDADFPLELIPDGIGLLVADAWEAHELRPAPERLLAPARRKAMMRDFGLGAGRRLAQVSGVVETLA